MNYWRNLDLKRLELTFYLHTHSTIYGIDYVGIDYVSCRNCRNCTYFVGIVHVCRNWLCFMSELSELSMFVGIDYVSCRNCRNWLCFVGIDYVLSELTMFYVGIVGIVHILSELTKFCRNCIYFDRCVGIVWIICRNGYFQWCVHRLRRGLNCRSFHQ